ncbi:type VI secretion system-associated lipoprotein [Yersinia pestis subsp. microtus bv. Caucasica]|nr:type VI secretion system-associated lipoprotein [Yersinia pestis subsp. microtus bv. Caucasica]OSZ88457.1 type VI secretion system-associated lipoprotein [Yersinia pestis subsp. microtus bv. Caucasica]OSZ89240.1 type VI secretion system-associated lipoprotein [Yersinia pestis subsp. microtus bv. Caucasica]OSZ96224.1 type VI secretion system-associated lipoprotein [Yersinia pestis subsp. microtus bv. Caucasica]
MGRESSVPPSRLITRLKRDIGQINFYRFCQLLEQQPGTLPLGSTNSPADDPVRFRPHPGMGFPVSELKALENDPLHPEAPLTARTTFMGLYGVDSPLPTAYIDDITQQREGHEALEGFLDIFNHRFMTQFYRIWRKYSYPATFESGGTDNTSQSLLGLIGMGIPGSQQHFATPTSRFLALLGVMRQPGRTAEGVQALVRLLAPFTEADVTPHCLRTVRLTSPMAFADEGANWLDGYTVLGDEAIDANSQLLISLRTADRDEAANWLPDGPLYTDFLVLLRVYLGWLHSNIKKETDVLTTVWKNKTCTSKHKSWAAWKNKICIPALVLLLSGCGLTQAVTDSTVSATKSLFYKQIKVLHLDFTAREALNTDAHEANSSSEPVMVRVYQLRDDKTFLKTVYQQLASDGEAALKDDLLASRSVVVKPGGAVTLDMPMEKETQFVAVVALFRHPDMAKDHWRLILTLDDLHPDKPRTLELGNNSLTLRTEKK